MGSEEEEREGRRKGRGKEVRREEERSLGARAEMPATMQPGKAYYTWHAFISTTSKSLRWSMKACWQIYYKQKQKPVSPWAK